MGVQPGNRKVQHPRTLGRTFISSVAAGIHETSGLNQYRNKKE
jgi:hypothetical protein